jgi:16S rRNA (guanine527-N7)-methyltransferase
METCQKILQQGLQALDIAYDENQLEALLKFIKLIEKWNRTYNLTAVRSRDEMARLHILDSLTVLSHIHGMRIADIGTGAGLPGIPLAIFLPETEFILLDSNSKKTRFVQQAILELNLSNVTVLHSRVENFQPDTLFSTVIMRAFANLQDIMRLTEHLIAPSGFLLAMKGQQPEAEEIEALTAAYSIIQLKIPELETERCLIRIEGVANHG